MSDSTFKSQTSSPLPADGNIKTQKLHRLMNKMFLSFFFFFLFWENSISLCLLLFTQTYKRHGKSAVFRDQLIQQHGISSVVPQSLTTLTHSHTQINSRSWITLLLFRSNTQAKPHPHKPHTVMFIPSTLAEQLHLIHIIHTYISYVNLHLFFPSKNQQFINC